MICVKDIEFNYGSKLLLELDSPDSDKQAKKAAYQYKKNFILKVRTLQLAEGVPRQRLEHGETADEGRPEGLPEEASDSQQLQELDRLQRHGDARLCQARADGQRGRTRNVQQHLSG